MKALLILLMLWCAAPAWGVDADEQMLADPRAEATARSLMAELRCLVCRNESIIDSHADLARDLRMLVRERIAAGEPPDAVRAYVVARYGEWVLLDPPARGLNLALWLVPGVVLLASGAMWFARARPSAARPNAQALEEDGP